MLSIFKGESLKFVYSKVWLFSEIIILVFSLFLIFSMSPNDDWKKELKIENKQIEQSVKMTSEEIEQSENSDENILKWKMNNKYLEKNNKDVNKNSFGNYLANLFSVKGLGLLIVIFPIIFCVGIAKEFENKTIDFILTSPFERRTFYWGKLLSNLMIVMLFLSSILIMNLMIGYLYFGGDGLSNSVYFISKHQLVEVPAINYIISSILRSLPYYLVYSVIGFSLAILTRSTVVSLTITLFLALLGNQVSGMLPFKSGLIFFLPAITDLTNYVDSPTYLQFSNTSIWMLLVIIFVYLYLMILGSRLVFERKDI